MQIIRAARGRITTHHGEDIGRGFPHVGIDIGHGDSTPDDLRIVAPAAGVITTAGRQGTYGNRIVITHPDGTWSLIAHLASYIERGSTVEQGQTVGVMGNTGTQFVHCHQEYHLDTDEAVDPLSYLGSTTTGTTTQEDEMAIQIIKEVDQPAGQNRYGVMGGASGFSHIQTMEEVNALLVGIGRSELDAVRGVNRTEFDRIATALTR